MRAYGCVFRPFASPSLQPCNDTSHSCGPKAYILLTHVQAAGATVCAGTSLLALRRISRALRAQQQAPNWVNIISKAQTLAQK